MNYFNYVWHYIINVTTTNKWPNSTKTQQENFSFKTSRRCNSIWPIPIGKALAIDVQMDVHALTTIITNATEEILQRTMELEKDLSESIKNSYGEYDIRTIVESALRIIFHNMKQKKRHGWAEC